MRPSRAGILVVDDDDSIRHALDVGLRRAGYAVSAVPDGRTIKSVLKEFQPDLAILDIRLPKGPDGYAIARVLRAETDIPIIFLTAADGLRARVEGFDAGADDYLVKPFELEELLCRVKAHLRRSGRLQGSRRRAGEIVLDEKTRSARRAGAELGLTRTEYELLSVLAENPGQVLSRVQLLTRVWGFDDYPTNLVDVHVSSLRRKLEAHGDRVIATIRGVGFMLRV